MISNCRRRVTFKYELLCWLFLSLSISLSSFFSHELLIIFHCPQLVMSTRFSKFLLPHLSSPLFLKCLHQNNNKVDIFILKFEILKCLRRSCCLRVTNCNMMLVVLLDFTFSIQKTCNLIFIWVLNMIVGMNFCYFLRNWRYILHFIKYIRVDYYFNKR